LRFGKNLEDIRYESDITETYNAIVPDWKSSDGKMLKMLPEKVIYLENVNNGTYDDLDDDEIIWSDGTDTNPDDLFTDSETGSTTTGNTSSGSTTISDVTSETKAVVLDLSSEFDDVPSDARLREVAIQRFNESLVPLTNIEVRFFELWNTTEYEKYASLQRVFLGDTVKVVYTDLGVNISKRVVKTVYDSLLERYESMELGTVQKSFGTTVAAKVKQEIMKITPTIDIMAEAIDHGTELLRGGLGGHVVIGVNGEGQPNEIFILDTDSIETAVHVLRININGIGFSSTGYNGTYDTAWTLDGTFYADFITAGTLSANRIKAGVLQPIVGYSFLNMLTGEFKFGGETTDYISFVNDPDGKKFLDIKANSISLQGNGVATNTSVSNAISTALNNYDPTSVLDQEKIFNILTNNSRENGLWLVDGHLYLNFTYAKGQTLKLGGSGNGNGLLEVYSNAGVKSGVIDNNGFESFAVSSDAFLEQHSKLYNGILNFTAKNINTGYSYEILEMVPSIDINGTNYKYFMNFNCPEKGFLFRKKQWNSGRYVYTNLFEILDDCIIFHKPVKDGLTVNNGLKVYNGITSYENITVTAGGINVTGGYIDISSSVNGISLFGVGQVYGGSDRRLKKNIKPSNVNIIDHLKVVQFDWKRDDSHVSAGLIAQDVRKICPELVVENKDGILGLNFQGLVPHLVKKVQEQQKEIDNLKKEIAEIKSFLKGMC
jgi:hypothetical protein